MKDLFAGFDPERLDAVAGKLVTAIIAIIDFAVDPIDDQGAIDDAVGTSFLQAAVAKALLTSFAAFVVHPHTDEEQDEEFIAGAMAFVRKVVTDLRVDG